MDITVHSKGVNTRPDASSEEHLARLILTPVALDMEPSGTRTTEEVDIWNELTDKHHRTPQLYHVSLLA